MDNSFYEETREERIRNRKSKEQGKSFMSKIIAVQLAASLLVTGLLFLVCKTDTELSKGVKEFYAQICQKDIAASKILDVVKDTAKSVFAPTVQDDTAENAEPLTEYEA